MAKPNNPLGKQTKDFNVFSNNEELRFAHDRINALLLDADLDDPADDIDSDLTENHPDTDVDTATEIANHINALSARINDLTDSVNILNAIARDLLEKQRISS